MDHLIKPYTPITFSDPPKKVLKKPQIGTICYCTFYGHINKKMIMWEHEDSLSLVTELNGSILLLFLINPVYVS